MSDIHLAASVGYRSFHLAEQCQESQGHTHNFDHLMVVKTGPIKVFFGQEPGATQESKLYQTGEWLVVKKNTFHLIKAMGANCKWDCIFLHREFDDTITEHYTGHARAYV